MAALAIPPSASQSHHATVVPSDRSNVIVFDETIDVDEDVTDFFDARFSSREDLANIKSVLQQQAAIANDLNQKLQDSKTTTAQVLKQAQNASKSALDRLQDLESSALGVEEQMENSESFASGKNKRDQRSLVDELGDLQTRVQALEDAKHYILTVSRTQKLISESKELLQTSVESALIPYGSLVELSNNTKVMLSGHGTKLESFLSASTESLLQDFKASLSKKFQASLDAIGWPKPIPRPFTIPDDKHDDFERSFKEILLLQEPTYGALDRSGDKPYPALLPIELMAAPLILRFKYHFEGNRPTNRPDKPEWYLNHVLELIKDHSPFLQEYVQIIVQETDYKEYDVKVNGPPILSVKFMRKERKIRLSAPTMLSSPEILSHAIYETLRFDKTLRESEFYFPPGQTTDWQGTVQVYLGNREWLKAWLRVEKEFASARYTQIIEDSDAWKPAYEDMAEKEYIIPTKSAEKLMDLLEIITERYRPLPVLEHRTFLLDIQLDILIDYHRHIRGLVDQYESLTYSFVRAMPGVASAEEINTMGIDGLRNLCQWLSSAEYISSTLKDWGEDVFFLELYKEISERAQKISNPLHSENDDSDEDYTLKKQMDANGTIFDDSIKGYSQLSKRIQELIVSSVSKEVFDSMRAYVSLRSWPQIEFSAPDSGSTLLPPVLDYTSSQHENDDVSPELYQPLNIFSHSLEFLATTLPTKHFTALYRQISPQMQDFFWHKIIMKNSFSELGGLQFARDIRIGVFGASRRWIKKPENYHRKLRDACILLSLQSAKVNSPPMLSFDQEDQENSASKHKNKDVNAAPVYATRTLAQIMAVLFDEDLEVDTVKHKLEEIGVLQLGINEAKDVIRRRVECWR
ncbi:hypothetical protein BG011_003571 [Mortierella polycephala]|uniref:RINT-1 family protein n=1 Tax=Mortierella polycephala TaxID=41804 RepID=A0A9P6Q3A2_9FUNG|nr:hypothetical protein BG011_003571 [Mortierella polycephala]